METVCAWCKPTKAGKDSAATSHGLCVKCEVQKFWDVTEEKWTTLDDALISSHGNMAHLDGSTYRTTRHSQGYRTCCYKGKQQYVHRLVAFAFCHGHRDGLVVNHKNAVRDDNRAVNLEWITQAENLAESRRQGRMSDPPLHCGVAQHCAKLNPEKVRKMRGLWRLGTTAKRLAKMFGVSSASAHKAATRRTWKHIT